MCLTFVLVFIVAVSSALAAVALVSTTFDVSCFDEKDHVGRYLLAIFGGACVGLLPGIVFAFTRRRAPPPDSPAKPPSL